MAKNLLAAMVTKQNGDVKRVYRNKKRNYTTSDADVVRRRFRRIHKPAIRRWARKRGWTVEFTRKDNPFVVYDSDTGRVNRQLENKINKLAQKKKKYAWIGEGRRTNYQQWEFRMAYLQGWGNLAARCCLKYWPDRTHSWYNCGKQSQSNHAPGNAADMGLLLNGKGNGSTDIGQVDGARGIMRELNLCLPVPGEDWHVEIGSYWAA